jgi:hypothetical protein
VFGRNAGGLVVNIKHGITSRVIEIPELKEIVGMGFRSNVIHTLD